MLEELRITA